MMVIQADCSWATTARNFIQPTARQFGAELFKFLLGDFTR
jgi:hypothetical protein